MRREEIAKMREEKKGNSRASERGEGDCGREGGILVMFPSGIKGQSEHCSLEGREGGREGGTKQETALLWWASDISDTICSHNHISFSPISKSQHLQERLQSSVN